MKNGAVLAWLSISGCIIPSTSSELEPITLSPTRAAPSFVREGRGALGGGADLYAPARTRPWMGSVWVLDAGNDRLVRFDSTLAEATTFSGKGEGPGELRFAMDMAIDRGRFVVGEIGNGRLSVFDQSGVFQRTINSFGVPKHVAAVNGQMFTSPGTSEQHYTFRLDGRPHASVPEVVERLVQADPRTYLSADAFLASDPRGLIHVLDSSTLTIATYDMNGRLLGLRRLPDPFRARLLEKRREEMEAWGGRAASFVSVPATKQISIDDRGRLLVPFSLPDHWGLLIDPADWTALPLELPDRGPERDILRGASDANLWKGHLYVLSQDRLYEFEAPAL